MYARSFFLFVVGFAAVSDRRIGQLDAVKATIAPAVWPAVTKLPTNSVFLSKLSMGHHCMFLGNLVFQPNASGQRN
ncbi:hypothetical protein C8J56DRAFT_16719 [Mycena floridula]|nr:hypothetical protein C8J56DRAFT_16719 [Mycena floridula]